MVQSEVKEKKTNKAPKIEKRQFEAETKELLNLMINSLYTHKEIFLRELISNSSDALDKLKIKSLEHNEYLEGDVDFKIQIEVDKNNNTLTISDNGVGMSYKEVIDNIGTIAKSGSKLFIKKLKQKDDVDLIGQFGVGFYSSFMVSKKVTLLTRAAGGKTGVKWESSADGTYTIEKVKKESRGTEIILHLKNEFCKEDHSDENYLNQFTIENLIKKYSDYIRYPIMMDFTKEETPRDKEGKVIENGEPILVLDTKQLNSMTPLWERDPKEIGSEEYSQLYKQHFHDWNGYSEVIHTKAEGKFEYTALLFVPSKAPSNLYDRNFPDGIQLYSNHVFIMKDCKSLLPDHLRFVKGLIDSTDFSLNISREILQHDSQLKVIGKHLEKKVLDTLKKMLKDKRDTYLELWKEYGKAIKGGIYMEFKNKEKLQDLLLFHSTEKKDREMTTLKEYVERMPKGQKEIYFAPGKDIETIEKLPHLEAFWEKGVEILYFTDKVDEFLTQNFDEYDGKKIKSISREDINLDSIGKKDDKKSEDDKKDKKDDKKTEKYKDLLECVKKHLGEKVKEVKISKRLKSSPVCLVTSGSGTSFNMEMLMKSANHFTPQAAKILELNPDHKVFKSLKKVFDKDEDSDEMKNYSEIMYNQALLIEGFELEDPVDFSNRLSNLLAEVYK